MLGHYISSPSLPHDNIQVGAFLADASGRGGGGGGVGGGGGTGEGVEELAPPKRSRLGGVPRQPGVSTARGQFFDRALPRGHGAGGIAFFTGAQLS